MEVTRNYNILNEAELRLNLLKMLSVMQRRDLQESSKSFETGSKTLANFLQSFSQLAEAYFEVISAKINYHIAKSKYLNSIGSLEIRFN